MDGGYYGSRYYLASAYMAVSDPSAKTSGTKGVVAGIETYSDSKNITNYFSGSALTQCFSSDYIYLQLDNEYPYLKGGETYYIITIA